MAITPIKPKKNRQAEQLKCSLEGQARLNINVGVARRKAFKIAVAQQGTTMTDVLVDLIDRYLADPA